MKKVNLIVSTSLLASLLNCCSMLTAQAQSYSSVLFPDSSLAANKSLNSSAGSVTSSATADGPTAASAGSNAAADGSTAATVGASADGSTAASACGSTAAAVGASAKGSTASEAAPSASAASSQNAVADTSGSAGTIAGDAAVKLSPAAMCPSASFPLSFGPDGKATLNALPGPINRAAASTFLRLLKEHLLTPSGLLSLAMNRAPGTTPSDFLMRSGKFDGLLMILSFIGSKVELSDSQIEQLQKIRNKLLDKSAPINADLTILERKFREQLIAPELDDKAMRSLRRQIGRNKDKLDALMTEHMIATSHVFTAEQRQRVRDMFMRMQAGPMGIKRPQEKKTTGD